MAQHFDQKIGRRFSRLRRGHWLEWLSGEARATLPFRLSSPVCVAVTGSPGRLGHMRPDVQWHKTLLAESGVD